MASSGYIQTPVFRLRFGHINQPKQGKYQISMLFKPGEDLSKLQAIWAEAIEKEYGSKKPKNLFNPIKDQDGNDYAGFVAGSKWASASRRESEGPPGIINLRTREPIVEPLEIYDGAWFIATINAGTWKAMDPDTKTITNQGASFFFRSLAKVRDDEPLAGGGKVDAAKDFAEIELPPEASADAMFD